MEAGYIMAGSEYPQLGAPVPPPGNILTQYMLMLGIGNSLELPQGLHIDAVFTNSALNRPPPIVEGAGPFDLLKEGQGYSHISILATEVAPDSAYPEGNLREPGEFYGSGSTLPSIGGNIFSENIIPGQDFTMEEGHIMAVPEYPEFGAPAP